MTGKEKERETPALRVSRKSEVEQAAAAAAAMTQISSKDGINLPPRDTVDHWRTGTGRLQPADT